MNLPATARPSRTTAPHGRQPALRVVSPSATAASAPEVAWSLLQRLGLGRSPAADGPVQTGFIIGTGRCGTTLLAQMLNAHPRICVPHELQILFEEQTGNGPRLWEAFERGDHLQWSARDFSAAIRRWCPYRLHRWFAYERFLRAQTYPIVDPGRLVGDLYAAIARSVGKDTFLEQTPWYGQRLDVVERLVPGARYVHMVRDGRDVAVSFARTPWWSDDVGHNLQRWHDEVRAIQRAAAALGIGSRLLTVRYEDVVDDPEGQLRRVSDFLDLPFAASMLDARRFTRYERFYRGSRAGFRSLSSAAFLRWRSSGGGPTFSNSVGAWRRCEDFDFARTPPLVARLLGEFGYERAPGRVRAA